MILHSQLAAKATKGVLGVIPARLASSRLTRKVLRPIAGRPMLAWVYEAAQACSLLEQVIVATDAPEIADLCVLNGWPYRLTSPRLPSGTDRVHAVAMEMPAEVYINIQGDEPLLQPEHVAALLRPFAREGVQVSTLKVHCAAADIGNPNVVKVVTSKDDQALYFSRATIPFDRDGVRSQYWKHLGFYAYRRSALEKFPTLPASDLEKTERLEQLRFLDNGISVHVEATNIDTIGVDTQEDLDRVEMLLLARNSRRIK